MPLQSHQRRILGRVLNEIEGYRAGRRTLVELLNNAWGLFEAAELREPERGQFLKGHSELSTADDRNQPWMPAGHGSDEAVAAALDAFEQSVTQLLGHDRDAE